MLLQRPTALSQTASSLVFGVLAVLLVLPSSGLQAAQCHSTTYAEPLRNKKQRSFSPDDTIYFYLSCNQFTETDQTLVIDWVTPAGKIRGQTIDSFSITTLHGIFQKVYAVKLPKKGFVSQVVTGVRYGDELYGTWTYLVHLNGVLMDRNTFVIQ